MRYVVVFEFFHASEINRKIMVFFGEYFYDCIIWVIVTEEPINVRNIKMRIKLTLLKFDLIFFRIGGERDARA